MDNEYAKASPKTVRSCIRNETITGPTAGMCEGFAQANLVILPKNLAYDFLLFAQRNPRSCPLLEVTDAGNPNLRYLAKDADVRTDLPRYRIYEHGVMSGEYTNITAFYQKDMVSFLIGCSFSFEADLMENGIGMRHIEEGVNVPMYRTNIPCETAGIFHGNMVVSMRPIPYEQVMKAVLITGAMPKVHGAPIHIGDPSVIGIHDLSLPDYGDAVTIRDGEVPVFWPCGVTPQAVIESARPEFVITHAPGHMLISDIKNCDLKY